MADELPCALGNRADDRFKEAFVECAGDEDTEAAIGSHHAFAGDHLVELCFVASQHFDFGITRPELGAAEQMRKRQWFERNKRVAHGLYSAGTGCTKDRRADRRQHVRVLVGVNVRDGDSSRLQCANLGGGSGFDLAGINLLPEVVARQLQKSVA